ncbi:MAG: carbon-nitrogen hydrolase family protein [Pirellulaceae bacterium]|nr:carbon-nitrogen hydrolase family protein [Pirellulaceae bacterium]
MSPNRLMLTLLLTLTFAIGLDAGETNKSSSTLRVATAQLPVTKDIAANSAAIHRALQVAIENKADILLTPEGSLSGYTPKFDQAEVDQQLATLVKHASEAGVALALGTCYTESDDNECYNQIRFYDKQGKFLGFHSKTLLCGSLTKPYKGEINDYATSPLRTFQINGIQVGGLICNDMWGNPQCTPIPDPHLSQRLSDAGAQIIFLAINGGRNGGAWSEQVYWPYHETNMRMRAASGRVWVVSADNCFPENIPCSAPSGVLTPSGEWAAQAPRKGEHVTVHTIQLGE